MHVSIRFNDTVEKGDGVMVSKSVGASLTSNNTYKECLSWLSQVQKKYT